MTVQDAIEELEFLKKSAERKAEWERERRTRPKRTAETTERVAAAYDTERDALQMAIDALKGRLAPLHPPQETLK